MFTVGQQCIFKPNGRECTILVLHSNRYRARIRYDNGQEYDEINYHDLAPKEGVILPGPISSSDESPTVIDEIKETGEYKGPGLTTPSRFRRVLRRGEEEQKEGTHEESS